MGRTRLGLFKLGRHRRAESQEDGDDEMKISPHPKILIDAKSVGSGDDFSTWLHYVHSFNRLNGINQKMEIKRRTT